MAEVCLLNHDTSQTAATYEESCIVDESDKIKTDAESIAENLELGFGTEYEKVILADIISEISRKYGIDSFLNFPKNNLLGNSKDVTKNLQEKIHKPDLLWNFCEFENEPNVSSFINSLENFNPKYVLIVTQNWRNPGVLIHFIYHKIFGKQWNHGYLAKMTTNEIEKYCESTQKYKLLEKGLFDAPWFILDVYETGKYLKKLVPKTKHSAEQTTRSVFERSATSFKKWASHHNYVLLKRI